MKIRFSALLALLLLTLTVSAQKTSDSLNRVRTYDVLHYVIRLKFDPDAKKVFGDSSIELTPLGTPLDKVVLDSEETRFDFVGFDGTDEKAAYEVKNSKITVYLDRKYEPGEKIALRFRYTALPTKGIYFVEAQKDEGKEVRSAQIWTQGESEETHHWLPSYDFPDDKATTEQYLTIPSDETAIANGAFLGKSANSDGTQTWHYRMDIPHSVYLTSFVIGKYVKVSDKYGDIPLGYYLYPGEESTAPLAFGRTKDMMRIFEQVTGLPYPYNKYDQIVVADFQWGGMENITATTLADTEIAFAKFKFGQAIVDDLVSHELAHSWFGDLVTCRNWAELWLNEGFATFMEAVYREKSAGRASYNQKVRQDANEYLGYEASKGSSVHALYNTEADASDDDSMFDTVTYQKGGAVLHTLREEIGDEAFWKGVNIYLNRHKLGNVESKDLKAAMEETSGKDLSWFFDQWVYKAGHPKLKVTHYYDAKKKLLKIRFQQTQQGVRKGGDKESNIPDVFVLPLEIGIKTGASTKTEKIRLEKRSQDVEIAVRAKPSKVTIDPSNKIPLKQVSVTEALFK